MAPAEITTRTQLYEAVWTRPMRDIAKAFGLKGGVISRICRRHNIPTPPPGYWQRVRSGEKVKRPVLPITERLAEHAVVEFPSASRPAPESWAQKGSLEAPVRAHSPIWGRLGSYERNAVPGMQSCDVITPDVEAVLASPPYRLTPRELEILGYLFDDRTNKEVGFAEGISHRTVEIHRASILAKTGTHGTITMVKLVIAISLSLKN